MNDILQPVPINFKKAFYSLILLLVCMLVSAAVLMFIHYQSGMYDLIFVSLTMLPILGMFALFYKARGGWRPIYYMYLLFFVISQGIIVSSNLSINDNSQHYYLVIFLKLDIVLFSLLLLVNIYYMMSAPVYVWFKNNKLSRKGVNIEAINPIETRETKKVYTRPWLRYWARFIDSFIYLIIYWGSMGIIFGLMGNFMHPLNNTGSSSYLSVGLMIGFVISYPILEASFISLLGTTIGKWLFSIKLLHNEISLRYKFRIALQRSVQVLFRGLGLLVPIANFVMMIMTYYDLNARGKASWDSNLDIKVVHGKLAWERIILSILLIGIFMVVQALFTLNK